MVFSQVFLRASHIVAHKVLNVMNTHPTPEIKGIRLPYGGLWKKKKKLYSRQYKYYLILWKHYIVFFNGVLLAGLNRVAIGEARL